MHEDWFSFHEQIHSKKLLPLLLALDPSRDYTGPAIAQLGRASGMLHYIYDGVDEQMAYVRTRSALSERRRRYLANQTSTLLPGWCWQNFACLEEATIWVKGQNQALGKAYQDKLNLEQRFARWSSLKVWPIPVVFTYLDDGWERWRKLREILMRVWLMRHAAERGLNPNLEYTSAEWYAPIIPSSLTALRSCLLKLDMVEHYTVDDLVQRASGLCLESPANLRSIRAGLHRMSRDHQFPELGDQTRPNLQPKWEGWRWHRAFISLQIRTPTELTTPNTNELFGAQGRIKKDSVLGGVIIS